MRKHVINKVYTGDLNSLEDIKQGELIIDDTFNNELISFKNDRGLFVSVETKTAVDKKINTKQNITDESLQTKTKEIVPAINEVLSEINIVQDTLEETEKELSANIDSINNTIDSINQDIQQNTNKINDVNTDLSSQINNVNKYVTEVTGELTTNVNNLVESTTESFTEVNKNIQDINIELNEKQDKEDSSLDTEDKTIVGAINELKDSVDSIKIPEFPEIFVSTVNGVSGNVSVPSFSDLLDLTNRIDSVVNDVTNNTDNINLLLDTKQDKEDSSLDTEDKTIVGAINEVNSKIPDISNLAKQSDLTSLTTKVNTNTSDISNLKNQVNTNTTNISNKQDKTDNSLTTTSKTVVGGINELKTSISSLAKQSDLSSLQTKVNTNTSDISNLKNQVNTNKTNISTNTTNITSLTTKVNTNTSDISNLKNNKQDKSDSTLTTTTKTVVGGINELKSDIDNLELELDNKQDKSDNTLKTSTKTVVGGINELDSKLKAEEFAGGLKVQLSNNGTAIITNEGIRVLDSTGKEKIKLVNKDISLSDFIVVNSERVSVNSPNGSIKYKDNRYSGITFNIGSIPSLDGRYKLEVDIYFSFYIPSAEFDENITIYIYINDNGITKDTITISIKKSLNSFEVKSSNGAMISGIGNTNDKRFSFHLTYNVFDNIEHKISYILQVGTGYSYNYIAYSFNHSSEYGLRYKSISNVQKESIKTIIGTNGFLNYYNPDGYFGAYHDGTNYQIVGKGKNNITYI